MDKINVVFCCSQEYLKYCIVAMKSIIDNTKARCIFYIIGSGREYALLGRMREEICGESNSEIRYVDFAFQFYISASFGILGTDDE